MTRRGTIRERMIALLALAAVLLLPPLLLVVNHPVRIFGIPALYAYLFGVWGMLILCGALLSRRLADSGQVRRLDIWDDV